MAISCLAVPASASGGVSGAVQDFFEWTVRFDESVANGFWSLIYGDDWRSAEREQLQSAYNTYVSNLQTDLGTTTLIDGGIRYWLTLKSADYPLKYNSAFVTSVMPVVGQLGFTWAGVYGNNVNSVADTVFFSSPVMPFAGYVRPGYLGSWSSSWTCGNLSYWESSNSEAHNAGDSLGGAMTFSFKMTDQVSFYVEVYPYLDLIPLSTNISDYTTQDITINSRPTSITGDYGILGDDGTITKVDGNVIVDESSSTVYNPVTNTTTNFTNWSYDYSDRSYNLTTEAGDTITVTYGDENITINEGDTIYNVYYVIPQEQPSDPGTDPGTDHTHTYTDEITKQPTCLLSGIRTYTCSCGDSYTKTVPATGHDWQISQQVPNTYDPETGEQTQAGYTVYACATCGEQYKSTDGTAPPNSSTGDDSSGGIGGVLSGLLGAVGDVIAGLIEGALTLATKAMEALTGLGDLVSQMIETVLGFFGGFIDFMAAMFPFLPEETFTILNLGLILMIAAAVFRKFLN